MKKFWMVLLAVLALVALFYVYSRYFSTKSLVMGTSAEFPPFELRGGADGANVVGFDVEVARAIAAKVGLPLKIEDMAFDGLLPGLATGRVDLVLAAMTITPERAKKVDFSVPYYKATQVVLIRKGDPEPAAKDDLKGRKIGVQRGTTGAAAAFEITGQENVRELASAMKAAVALMNSQVDFAIIDEEPAVFFQKKFARDIQLVRLAFDAEFYGVAVQKGNAELLAQVNAALGEIAVDGRYDQFFDLWMVQQVDLWESLDEAEVEE